MTVFAGVNGAGKSQLTEILAHHNQDFLIIDADAIARRLNPSDPEKAALAVGRETIRLVRDAIEAGKNFTIETTLGGGNALRQMKAAKEQGYHINLYFIGLDSVEHHIDRVAQRVSKGGHDVPVNLIRQRYKTSHENLLKTLRDNLFVIDEKIAELQGKIPATSDPKVLQSKVSQLNSVIDAIHAALQRVGQEIFTIQNQQNIRQMQRQYRHVRQPSQANTQELEL
jgi:predicted ABC-type ATPase